jgi:predicted acylesterase/phospholipase RssA
MTARADILRRCDLVLSGGAAHIPFLSGACRALEEAGIDIMRVSGTSSGSIVAAALASGMTGHEMLALGEELLGHYTLTPRRTFGLLRDPFGLHSLEPLASALYEHLPARMMGALIPWGAWVVDAETLRAHWIHSGNPAHGHLYTRDVVTASCALWPFFDSRRIAGMRGRFIDGGFVVNVGASVWDDDERPTCVIRLDGQGTGRERVDIRTPVGMARAAVGALMQAASAHVPSRHWPTTLTVKTHGDGLDFNQSPVEVRKRERSGYDQAQVWLAQDVAEVVR